MTADGADDADGKKDAIGPWKHARGATFCGALGLVRCSLLELARFNCIFLHVKPTVLWVGMGFWPGFLTEENEGNEEGFFARKRGEIREWQNDLGQNDEGKEAWDGDWP